jgi:hypothetical protein
MHRLKSLRGDEVTAPTQRFVIGEAFVIKGL